MYASWYVISWCTFLSYFFLLKQSWLKKYNVRHLVYTLTSEQEEK